MIEGEAVSLGRRELGKIFNIKNMFKKLLKLQIQAHILGDVSIKINFEILIISFLAHVLRYSL